MNPKILMLAALLAIVVAPRANADVRHSNFQAANANTNLVLRLEDLQATMIQLGERSPELERPFLMDQTSEVLPKPDKNYVFLTTTAAKSQLGNLVLNCTFVTGEIEAEVKHASDEMMAGYKEASARQGIELLPIVDQEKQWPGAEFYQFRAEGRSMGNLVRIGEGKHALLFMLVGADEGFADSKHINALLSRKAAALMAFKPEFHAEPVR